jgi:hypothetical protein
MSLSFPGLISTVPLYSRDFTRADDAKRILRVCHFSDGGLSSNFPIHFFDRLWPNAPTFAISLDDFHAERHRRQVWLPGKPGSGVLLPLDPVLTVGAFVARLLASAKDWQDNLQSRLPGYRERIVHIVLKPDEGGLNLAMAKQTIEKLAKRGRDAACALETGFDLEEHRWRRFLISMARVEQAVDDLVDSFDGRPGLESFETFLGRYPGQEKRYRQSAAQRKELLQRAADLVACGRAWRKRPQVRKGNIPRPRTDLRITPKF